MGLYLYPPVLADILVPLTRADLSTASYIWLGLNTIFLCGTIVCLIVLLDLHWISFGALLVVIGAFSFSPVVNCFAYGQITVLLLFLWTLATTLHVKGHPIWSGIFFALAAAIKVAPAIVLIPFLVWRNWKWAIAFGSSLLGAGLVCVYVNTPGLLSVYFGRVMPAMSRAIPELPNMSIAARVQLMVWAARGHAVLPDPLLLPPNIVLIGKLVSTSIVLTFVAAIALRGYKITVKNRMLILGLLSLLCPVVSPVSWLHAYALSFFGFAILWGDALRSKVSNSYLALLTACSLLIGSYVWPTAVLRTAYHHHDKIAAALSLGALLVVCLLVFARISKVGERSMYSDERYGTVQARS